MGDFLDDAGSVFRNVKNCATGALQDYIPGHDYQLGVELAKYNDFTVLIVLDRTTKSVVYFDRFNQIDWNIQKQKICDVAGRYQASVLIDSTGSGDPIFEDLIRMGLNIEGYKFSHQSKKALVDNLILIMEQMQITYPDIIELINELQGYEYELTHSGKLTTNARTGHDDCVIALALACWGMNTDHTGVEIGVYVEEDDLEDD
jgi:phage FluMu gp28-like protein